MERVFTPFSLRSNKEGWTVVTHWNGQIDLSFAAWLGVRRDMLY